MAQHSTKKNKRRARRRRGGSFATGPPFVSAGSLVIQPNLQAGGPDCLSAVRPGTIPQSSYGGLPGLSLMRGGRYGMSLSALDPARGIVGPIAQAVPIPCESGRPNSMNLRGGKRSKRRKRGGGGGGGGGGAFPVLDAGNAPDMMTYRAQTAGYNNQVTSSGGVPLMIQVPYAAKSCIGGTRRVRKARRKAHKKTHRRRQ